MKNFKVFDCFTFYNELDTLHVRFEELNDFVDYFILCESHLTHRGKEKPLYFEENKDSFEEEEDDSTDDGENQKRKRRRSSERRPHTLGLGEIPADEFGTPTRQRSCNCKNSKCLKLYCECFAAGVHCDMRFCRCVNCCNNAQNETVRKEAIAITLEKNPNAFKPKVRSGVGCVGESV